MIHFLYLGTQLWQNDWHKYEKPGVSGCVGRDSA
jgi:hypothetical protein